MSFRVVFESEAREEFRETVFVEFHVHPPYGTGSSSKIFWMIISLVFSSASAS